MRLKKLGVNTGTTLEFSLRATLPVTARSRRRGTQMGIGLLVFHSATHRRSSHRAGHEIVRTSGRKESHGHTRVPRLIIPVASKTPILALAIEQCLKAGGLRPQVKSAFRG